MEEKFEKILEDHGIYEEDVTEILNAVRDMLEYAAEKTRREYPYATNTVDRLEKAIEGVTDIIGEL